MSNMPGIDLEEDAKEYLARNHISHFLECMMAGIMYSRPEDPVAFMEECMSKVRGKNLGEVEWDTFIDPTAPHVPKQRQQRRFKDLPPVEPRRKIVADPVFTGNDGKKAVLPPVERNLLAGIKVYFVLGGPGSGKGTQCANLVRDYGLTHLSAGDLLREEAKNGTERGDMVAEMMKEGKIVPMEITVALLRDALLRHKDSASGFLIDGFPRKMDQAQAFEEMVTSCEFVLFFDCTEATMEKRLLKRGETSGRTDDNKETIIKRFRTFVETSMPVVDHYKALGKVREVSSEATPDEVYAQVQNFFGPPPTAGCIDKPVYFVLGGPGSGKGTQCARISERFGLSHLSTGDLLRGEVASGSELGKRIESVIKAGDLVTTATVIELLKSSMLARPEAKGFLVDGFPREIAQAHEFEAGISKCEFVLYFECSEETMEQRLLKRGETSGRADDNAESIRKRFRTFLEVSFPVIQHYEERGLVRKVSSEQTPDEVFAEVERLF